MPTNVTAEFKRAEDRYRRARAPRERLSCLLEMLRTIPKHKGTEHLQANIKTRIKQLKEELAGGKRGGRAGPSHTIRPEGAAQIALLGPPNSGKSRLHARLTGSHALVGPYPFTTHAPMPGMFSYEGAPFQLVDLPPVSAGHLEPCLPNTLHSADAALLVVDVSDPACVDQVLTLTRVLGESSIELTEHWPGFPAEGGPAGAAAGAVQRELFWQRLPVLLVANKTDLDADPDEVKVLEELAGVRFPALSVSAETGAGCDAIARRLFHGLGIVRVYPKVPGREADRVRPFTVRKGDTVLDVARLVHQDVADGLQFARVWGRSGRFNGQQVGPDHAVSDGDIVELHAG